MFKRYWREPMPARTGKFDYRVDCCPECAGFVPTEHEDWDARTWLGKLERKWQMFTTRMATKRWVFEWLVRCEWEKIQGTYEYDFLGDDYEFVLVVPEASVWWKLRHPYTWFKSVRHERVREAWFENELRK